MPYSCGLIGVFNVTEDKLFQTMLEYLKEDNLRNGKGMMTAVKDDSRSLTGLGIFWEVEIEKNIATITLKMDEVERVFKIAMNRQLRLPY